jgi:hypothetical protein
MVLVSAPIASVPGPAVGEAVFPASPLTALG